ncbi:nitrate reductase molybdenum cofactor assembly chaperone [Trinickia symbiotica]|uniref:Nitrate reductase molybdenum cofactor assembly chaperone n=1 Tax=Trinickia symbiotica TaxID=863227 RepID=A0A2T3XQY0_9BURK|nr:nitrate reductase molybdenum cofactor assembly chaperone [Trinickia symbiotica]PTB18933.1 nitrate reductase molybdenum cofactor assembly chaperone [Trinickia symbiotica]
MSTAPDATYAAFSALLDYPDEALLDALDSIEVQMRDVARSLQTKQAGLERFFEYLRERDLLTLQENYVALFDRGRSTSLHLFEHIHGESRDRGQTMVDLLRMYEQHGLFLKPGELPDYLPVFLEYLSRLPGPDARALLGETGEILRAIAEQLARRGSHYSFLVGALLPLMGAEAIEAPTFPDDDAEAERPSAADYRALDAAYGDEPVRFVGATAPAEETIRFYDKRPGRQP